MRIKHGKVFFGCFAAAISGTLFISTAQPVHAQGDHHGGFKSFREQNPDLSRHTARQMFISQRRNASSISQRLAGPTFTMSQGPDGIIRCGTPDPITPKQERLFNNLHNQSKQIIDNGIVKLSNGIDLDLTSQTRNITLGKNLFCNGTTSVTITLGGESKSLNAGSQVTAAEYVAVKQVLSGGEQKLKVDLSGAAVGGDVDLSALTNENDVMRASNLVVARNVITYGDFGKRSDFRLLGNLDNFGTVEALSSDNSVKGGAIRAEDISNNAGATINSKVDLTLDAKGTLSNDGNISSTQSLTLTAANAINNRGAISALKDVDLSAPNLTNSGVIHSNTGNITLNAPDTLNVDNTGGAIIANNGAINVRSASYDGTAASTVTGGDLFSKELNINSGNGMAEVYVNQLTGTVNQTGSSVHVLAATDKLEIGDVCLTGDPTFYNTLGDINITGNVFVQENLVIAAAGDITSGANLTIRAASATQGFNITLIAGASIEPTSGSDSPTVPTGATPGGILLSGKGSKTGGGIVFDDDVVISTEPTNVVGNLSAGNINMVAFGGKTPNAGKIDLSTSDIQTGGVNLGNNGDVQLIAAGKDGPVITTGHIDTQGSTAGVITKGALQLFAGAITTFPKGTVEYDASGNLLSTSILTTLKQASGDILLDGSGLPVDDIFATSVFISTGGSAMIESNVHALSAVFMNAVEGVSTQGVSIQPVKAQFFTAISGGSIGSLAQPIPVDVGQIIAQTKGDTVAFDVAGSGPLTVLTTFAAEHLSINAPNRVLAVPGADFLRARVIDLKVSSFNISSIVTTQINLETTDPGFDIQGGFAGKKLAVNLTSAAGIGTSGSFFDINGNSSVTLTAADDIFVNQSSTKATEFTLTAGNDINLTAQGSTTILKAASTNGELNATVNAKGTLTVDGDIDVVDEVNLVNSDPAGKIVLEANTTISTSADTAGLGNVNISVGPANATVVPTPENIVINTVSTGTATFTGFGATAKTPVNTLFLDGADININNGIKSGNLSFGGNVEITAD